MCKRDLSKRNWEEREAEIEIETDKRIEKEGREKERDEHK